MLAEIAVAAVFYFMQTSVFADGSCLTAEFVVTDGVECRGSDWDVWCPNQTWQCEASAKVAQFDALYPACGTAPDPWTEPNPLIQIP